MSSKKSNKKSKFSSFLFGAIAIGCFAGAGYYGYEYFNESQEIKASAKADTDILSIALNEKEEVTKEKEADPIDRKIDWNALSSENVDIKAWIYIPGTKIDYPILQSNDNSFYLNNNYKKEWDLMGSIFMDYRQPENMTAYNTFLYGHDVDLSVPSPKFGELRNYYKQDFFDSHRDVYLYTPDEVKKGTVFAVHADSAGTKSHDLDLYSPADLFDYASFMKDSSVIKTDYDVTKTKSMITLWSCLVEEITNTNGEYVPESKSRTFVSVSFE